MIKLLSSHEEGSGESIESLSRSFNRIDHEVVYVVVLFALLPSFFLLGDKQSELAVLKCGPIIRPFIAYKALLYSRQLGFLDESIFASALHPRKGCGGQTYETLDATGPMGAVQ